LRPRKEPARRRAAPGHLAVRLRADERAPQADPPRRGRPAAGVERSGPPAGRASEAAGTGDQVARAEGLPAEGQVLDAHEDDDSEEAGPVVLFRRRRRGPPAPPPPGPERHLAQAGPAGPDDPLAAGRAPSATRVSPLSAPRGAPGATATGTPPLP